MSEQKKVISAEEFKKRIEIEAQNLMYFEYMNEREAFRQAKEYVETKFELKQ